MVPMLYDWSVIAKAGDQLVLQPGRLEQAGNKQFS
jgi:hypothetical protein